MIGTRYLCCCCSREFEGEQIEDRFAAGVRRGFLCPHCGSNIEDPAFGADIAYSSPAAQHYTILLMAVLVLESLAVHWFDLFDLRSLLIIGLLDLPLILWGLWRFPREMLNPTMQTRRVPH